MQPTEEFIYDWNEVGRRHKPFGDVEFFDETLRDGLQNPSVKDPTIGEKLELIHLMDSLGIHAADIGLPGSTNQRGHGVSWAKPNEPGLAPAVTPG